MGMINDYYNPFQTGGLQHLKAYQIRDVLGLEEFESYYRFAFVRNPFTRIASQFCYIKKRKDLLNFLGVRKDVCFEEYLHKIRTVAHVQWEPEIRFVKDFRGQYLVDDVFKIESFNSSFEKIVNKLNLGRDVKPIHLNANDRRDQDYAKLFNNTTHEMVVDMFRVDFEEFGYSKVLTY